MLPFPLLLFLGLQTETFSCVLFVNRAVFLLLCLHIFPEFFIYPIKIVIFFCHINSKIKIKIPNHNFLLFAHVWSYRRLLRGKILKIQNHKGRPPRIDLRQGSMDWGSLKPWSLLTDKDLEIQGFTPEKNNLIVTYC